MEAEKRIVKNIDVVPLKPRDVSAEVADLIDDAPYLACEVERLTALCGELVGAIENIMRLRDTDYGGATAAAWTSSFTGLRIALNKAKGGDE